MTDRDSFPDRPEAHCYAAENDQRQVTTGGSVGAEFANPAPNWERFTIVERLGEGAMGRVYRAIDRRLQRTVALKFMRSDDPEQVERFQREARAQARIEHDHVCRIYEVGEVDGRAYIAMQLIEGRSLKDLAPDLGLEQKVRLVEQVARAAQAAHSMGVIHRDLKPGNIMVEQEAGGALHAYVLDFGIAREVEAPGMTMVGSVVGTPAFMAPEQVRGEPGAIDRRADVYAIGATLYHLISGKQPFSGTTRMATMLQVLETDPPPLRQLDSDAPRDLEMIVAQCMEKEPHRRYTSARALADDLRRYLDGEPVAARRAGPFYRLGKRVRKHKTVAAVVAVAVAAVLVLGGALVWQSVENRRRQELAQEFGQELEKIDGMLRQVRMLPLHDVKPVEDLARKRMRKIEQTMESMGDVAFGPGSHALGVGHLGLGELEEARRYLQAAWDSGYRPPELDGALGHVLGEMYLREAETAGRIRNADLRAARLEEVDRELRQPALRHLKNGPAGFEEMTLHHAALAALLEGQFDGAIAAARESYNRHPWLFESMRLEADILVQRGKTAEETGRTEDANADYEAAGEVLGRAIEVGRSDAALYQNETARLIRVFNLESQQGRLREDLLQRALGVADAAETARPGDPRPYNQRSKIYWLRGEYELNHGLDPTGSLNEAVRLASQAAEMAPGSAQAFINQGMIFRLEASYHGRRGEDPRPFLEAAIDACTKALTIDPDSAVAWLNLGTANYLVAEHDLTQGLDPSRSLEAAAQAYDQSSRVRPTFAARSNAGLVHWQRAEYRLRHGEDPRESLEEAARCFAAAIELNPNKGQVHSNRGLILLERAEYEAEMGGDPVPWLERSLAVLQRAVELTPEMAAGFNNLGNAYKLSAVVEMAHGRDPRASLDLAVAAYEQAIEIDPALAYQFNNLGFSWELRAEYEALSGGDPRPALSEARDNLRQALKIEPDMAFAHHNLALCCRTEARYLVDSDRSPAAVLSRGRRHARMATTANPDLYDLRLMEGELDLIAAEWAVEHGGPVEQILDNARRSFEQGAKLNPSAPSLFLDRARSARLLASWLLAQGENPGQVLSEGLNEAERGLALDSADADFLLVKGWLHLLGARAAELEAERRDAAQRAVEALTAAEGLNPLLELTCDPLIAEAQLLHAEGTG
jgi:serine/threonine-protein kinase